MVLVIDNKIRNPQFLFFYSFWIVTEKDQEMKRDSATCMVSIMRRLLTVSSASVFILIKVKVKVMGTLQIQTSPSL